MQGKTLAEDLVKCKETPSIVSVIKQTKYRCDSLKEKNTQKLLCKSKWNEGKWVSLRLSKARSSHRRCSVRKGILKNFAKFTGKHLCQSLFFNKVTGLRPATLLKKRLWHRCFPVNFAKFLRTPFLQNTSGKLFSKGSEYSIPLALKSSLNVRKTFLSYSFLLGAIGPKWPKLMQSEGSCN